jgi:preprotein translocase subunit SecY
VFLAVIAVLPQLLSRQMNVPDVTAQFFGGTSLLIVVGVVLDTMRQVETHLIQKNYDGFLRKAKGGPNERSPASVAVASQQRAGVLSVVAVCLVVLAAVCILVASRLR